MKILVTGATGFIGSHLAEKLHQKGHTLRCIVRKTSNLQWIRHLPIEYVYGDLFDEDELKKSVTGIDVIYHVAGITKAKNKEDYYRSNQIATKNLLQAAARHNPGLARFIHVSSQAAVGPSTEGTPIDENTPFHPITTYGLSKMEAEKECLRLMDKLPITIVRPPAVYGPRDKDVFEFFSTISKGLHPMIGLKDTYVSLIHVKDLVDGIILAGEHPGGIGRTYFISSERFYSWKELGGLTAAVMNKRVLRLRIPTFIIYIISTVAELAALFSSKPALLNLEKAKDIVQGAWTCSTEKAKREIGFKESFSIREGIRETVEWYRTHGWLN